MVIHLLKWLKSKTLTTSNVGKDVKPQEFSYIAGENAKWYKHFWRQFAVFLTKLNIGLLYHMAITLLGIYSNKLNIYIRMKTCPWMFACILRPKNKALAWYLWTSQGPLCQSGLPFCPYTNSPALTGMLKQLCGGKDSSVNK